METDRRRVVVSPTAQDDGAERHGCRKQADDGGEYSGLLLRAPEESDCLDKID